MTIMISMTKHSPNQPSDETCNLCNGLGQMQTDDESGMYYVRCPWCRPKAWMSKMPFGFQLEGTRRIRSFNRNTT